MNFSNLTAFLKWAPFNLVKGPYALIFAEDHVELESTVDHHLALGFSKVIVFGTKLSTILSDNNPNIIQIDHSIDSVVDVVFLTNAVQQIVPNQWFYYGFNAEYFYYPFCETRTIAEFAVFCTEERRDSVLSFVIDVYAGDLKESPNGVNRSNTYLDRSGYYALDRVDPWNNVVDRQMNFFGGLKRRFEEHIPKDRRRIDRVAFFRSSPSLRMNDDFTFNIEEYNTYSCPWHNNASTAVASYRTAKALKRNPGSTFDIHTFWWDNSDYFNWNSQQLMDLGLMEPGQWF